MAINTFKNLITFYIYYSDATNEFTVKQENYLVKKPANTKPFISERKQRRYGSCSGCTRDDCGQCRNCLDMIKFGGSGKKKQACVLQKCSQISAVIKQEDTSSKIPNKQISGTNMVSQI